MDGRDFKARNPLPGFFGNVYLGSQIKNKKGVSDLPKSYLKDIHGHSCVHACVCL